MFTRSSFSRALGPFARMRSGTRVASAVVAGVLLFAGAPLAVRAESSPSPSPSAAGPTADLAEIEACVTRNLPDQAGRVDFDVEAVDRTGAITASRAEVRWRKDADALAQMVLRVSEPAKTAGTALLIVDRESDQPEFFVRLPEVDKVRKVRAKRLRGPVLGTDFSYEDLKRLREPVDRREVEVVGPREVDGRAAWLLEAQPRPEEKSEYTRVHTYIDQATCVPIRLDLFAEQDELRKRLRAPVEEIRPVGNARFPHVFVMEDLVRQTHTVIRVREVETSEDLPADQFTKHALKEPPATAAVR